MISTIRSTSNVLADRRVIDISKKIDVLEPDSAPLVQLTKKLGKRVAINPKFNWMEEESLDRVDAVNYSTGYTAGATSIAVDTGTLFRAGDVVKDINTGEQLLVTAVSTNDLTVTRAFGTTSATTITDNDVLLIIGSAYEEGATKGTPKVGDQTEKTNYTQIFRTPFGITATADASEMYGGKDLKHQRMMQLIEHQKDIERAFWFGEPKEITSGTHPRRATGGVDYWISTNLTDGGGTLTEIEFETFLRTGFRYGSKVKWLFASPIVVAAVNFWAKGALRLAPKDKTYGLSVMQWVSPFGLVNIVLQNIFTETTTYSGYAYLLDMEGKEYRYLTGRDTRLKTNIQANDADSEEDEYISECGLEHRQEKKDALLYNVTSYSA